MLECIYSRDGIRDFSFFPSFVFRQGG
jgi:hypothetical protein